MIKINSATQSANL
jgi:hypothetical protein